MKFFLKLFLILFVSNASAARDLQQEAFDVLARSVRLKKNAVLNQNSFGPAIKSLTTFLRGRYPELEPKPIISKPVIKTTTKPAQQNVSVVHIRKATVNDKMSPEVEQLLENPTAQRNFTPEDFNKEYECIIQGHYCKAKLIPLVCAVGAYLHFHQALNPDDQDIKNNIMRFSLLLSNILTVNFLTAENLNTLYRIEANIKNEDIILETTLAGAIFRYSYLYDVETYLKEGGDPFINGYYQGPSEDDPNKIIQERNPVGLFSLYHPAGPFCAKKIIDKHPKFKRIIIDKCPEFDEILQKHVQGWKKFFKK